MGTTPMNVTDQRDVHTGSGVIADTTPKADVVTNATAVIDAKRKPLRDAASLTADFAKHGYPPPIRSLCCSRA